MFSIDRICCKIDDVNRRSRRHHATCWGYSAANWGVAAKFSKGKRRVMSCREV